jgi:hypothetical protein
MFSSGVALHITVLLRQQCDCLMTLLRTRQHNALHCDNKVCHVLTLLCTLHRASCTGGAFAAHRRAQRQHLAQHPPAPESTVDAAARTRLAAAAAAQSAQDNTHLLDTTESTLKFGTLCMVLHYLHAMAAVRRERESWSTGMLEPLDSGGASQQQQHRPHTVERLKMVSYCSYWYCYCLC